MVDKPLSTEESLAVAVLRGDLTAACALADLLLERHGQQRIVPVTRFSVGVERIRAVLTVPEDTTDPSFDELIRWQEMVRSWLRGTGQMILPSGAHLDLYELPEVK